MYFLLNRLKIQKEYIKITLYTDEREFF